MYTLITTSNVIPVNFTGIVEYHDGAKQWFVEGEVHREDGPAYINNHGDKVFYFYGNKVTEARHKILVDKLNNRSCIGTTVIVDGKKYKLEPID